MTIDITWNVANVDESRRLVGAAMRHTLFKRITMYMKHYLFMHGLGVPYHGGLGSFPLYLPVIFHLQVRIASTALAAGRPARAFTTFALCSGELCLQYHARRRLPSSVLRVLRADVPR